tara:strand:- start:26 stop:184 length:159 start_codon:yes stop_codon:yes gene_type:complete
MWFLLGFLVGIYVGWVKAHLTVADECKRLGRFYVRKDVFECTEIKENGIITK